MVLSFLYTIFPLYNLPSIRTSLYIFTITICHFCPGGNCPGSERASVLPLRPPRGRACFRRALARHCVCQIRHCIPLGRMPGSSLYIPPRGMYRPEKCLFHLMFSIMIPGMHSQRSSASKCNMFSVFFLLITFIVYNINMPFVIVAQ